MTSAVAVATRSRSAGVGKGWGQTPGGDRPRVPRVSVLSSFVGLADERPERARTIGGEP